jgi:predicted DCC family thiol-disulfide oxidoreductase YuxK
MNGIILFDGVCNFCESSVQFIIKRDPKGHFHFASLQSDVGQKLLKEFNAPEGIDSIILIENGQTFVKSSAALRISKQLSGFWKLFYSLRIIPVGIRDYMYDIIAKNRYKWFGKKESCMLPSDDIRKRFL